MSDSQRLRAIIEGDSRGAVRAFDQVADGADRMGKDVDRAAKKSGRSLRDLKVDTAQVGQGLAAMGAAFAIASREVSANQQAIRTLRRGYGEATEGLQEFADEIQRTTTFSNESAITAANNFRNLTDQYGFTVDQVRTLIQVSADLATTSGLDLADAAFRVQSAMRGEAEAAELLGLTLNDASLGIDRLSKDTTNAEKSQIRYNALLDQASFAQGAAAERAATTGGQVEQLANRTQDATQRFIEFTGPVGEAAGSLGSFGLEAGLAAGGLVRLGQGLRGAVPLVAGLATGPVGLGVLAGAAIAAGAAFLIMRDDAETLEDQIVRLDDAQLNLRESADQAAAKGAANALVYDALTTKFELLGDTIETAVTTRREELLTLLDQEQAELAELEQAWRGPNGATQENTELVNEQRLVVAGLAEDLRELDGAAGLVADAQLALAEVMTHTGDGAKDAQANVVALFKAYEQGAFGAVGSAEAIDGLAQAIIDTAEHLPEYDRRLLAAAESTEGVGTAAEDATEKVGRLQEKLVGMVRDLFAVGDLTEASDEALRDFADHFDDSTSSAEQFETQLHKIGATLPDIAAAQDEHNQQLEEYAAQLKEAEQAAIDFVAQADNIDDVLLAAGAALSGDQGIIRLSQDIDRTRSQLDSLFAVVAGGTQTLGQSSQAVADWSDELVAPGQRFGEIERALSTGRITLEEYNAAFAANTRITENNEAAQAHLTAIQVKQLPLLASYADSYEDHLETLSQLPAAEQRVALAFADSGERAKIAEQFSTAYAVSLGEIPEAVATDMIVSAAQADPVLRGILTDYGLIEEGAEGQLKVNFPDADTITDAVGDLANAIEDLSLAIALMNDNPLTPTINTSQFDLGLADVMGKVDGLREGFIGLPETGGLGPVAGQLEPNAVGAPPVPAPDTTDFDATMADVFEQIDIYRFGAFAPPVPAPDVDTAQVDRKIGNLEDQAANWGDLTTTATVDADARDANDELGQAEDRAANWGNLTETATVAVNDLASGVLSNVIGNLQFIDGFTATSRLTTINETIFQSSVVGGPVPFQHGGVVPSAQHGIVTPGGTRFVRMNESGGEDVVLPANAMVRPAPASRLSRGDGGGGGIHIHGPVYLYPATTDVEDAFRSHFMGMGR